MDDYKTSIPVERIEKSIFLIRGNKVLMDSDLADLYDVETKYLIQAVKRNIERFPPDFMFQLTQDEFSSLRSQIVTSKGKGGRRYLPYALTEQGVAMFILTRKLCKKSLHKYPGFITALSAARYRMLDSGSSIPIRPYRVLPRKLKGELPTARQIEKGIGKT
jgi:hypothetical protein